MSIITPILARSLRPLAASILAMSMVACGSSPSSSPTENAAAESTVDSDADGVVDTKDNCPVNVNGNQADADGDGIGDSCDNCAGTQAGASVDGNGCAASDRDSDGDGVNDDQDNCPGTPADTAVDANGCPSTAADSDMDGINDANDVCPNSALTDSNSQAFTFFASGCPQRTSARDGISYDVFLTSDVDGERIAFTVHEPRTLGASSVHPIIGQGHGYSQRRTATRPNTGDTGRIGRLLDANFGLFSMDQRGHGDSGGQIRLLDPEVEGQDMLQILDWVSTNISWLEYENSANTDYVLGGIGSSYGGGFQHTLMRLDPLNRLDAMMPDITWHDLRYSISTNGVFKTKWALFLSGVAQSTPGGHHQQVNDGLQRGITTGDVNDEERQLIYRSSMAYNCDGTNSGDMFPRASTNVPMDIGRPVTSANAIPALYTQGPTDTLFDFTEAYRNHRCLLNANANLDVRVYTQEFGHDALVGPTLCGNTNAYDVMVAFFDAHLRGNTADLATYPQFCFNLAGKAIQRTAAQGFPYGNDGNTANDLNADLRDPVLSQLIPFTFAETSTVVQNVEVYTATQVDEILLGVPTIELDIKRLSGFDNVPTPAIVFVGIAISTDAGATWTLTNNNTPPNGSGTGTGQMTPFKDTDITAGQPLELAGVEVVLQPGHKVAVQFAARDAVYQNSGSKTPIQGTIEATVHLPLLGARGGLRAPAYP